MEWMAWDGMDGARFVMIWDCMDAPSSTVRVKDA